MIEYRTNLDGITPDKLNGFFVGWPSPPTRETLFRILKQSHAVVLAIESGTGEVVGFINALSDGILSAYIPLLEVLPQHQGKGIGLELTSKMVKQLDGLYMVDIVCDSHLETFYRRAGFSPLFAMIRRNNAAQSGRK